MSRLKECTTRFYLKNKDRNYLSIGRNSTLVMSNEPVAVTGVPEDIKEVRYGAAYTFTEEARDILFRMHSLEGTDGVCFVCYDNTAVCLDFGLSKISTNYAVLVPHSPEAYCTLPDTIKNLFPECIQRGT